MKKKNMRRRNLLTLATMTACAVASRLDAVAATTPNAGVNPAGPAPAQLPVRRFHIVAGTLDMALEAYKQQSGVSVKVSIAADQLATFHTVGLQGL